MFLHCAPGGSGWKRWVIKGFKKRLKMRIAVNGTPVSQLRDVTCYMDHTVLPATRHRWTRPALILGYSIYLPQGMEGWVDLGYPAMHRPGVKLTISRSQVQRPNHYTTEPPSMNLCGWWFGLAATRWSRSTKLLYARHGRAWMGDCLRAGTPSRYITSHLGQHSLSSLRGY